LTVTADDIKAFFDRSAFKAYSLRRHSDQATAQTARTLRQADGDDWSNDTIEVDEFCSLILRFVADMINRATELGARGDHITAFTAKMTRLDSVDDAMIEYARALAKTKMLFRFIDKSGDGSVSRAELYGALRRFKVPLTKSDFAAIFRVIDPDQSRTMTLEEWVDFMMATDEDLEGQALDAAATSREKNVEKGTGLGVFVGEGAESLFGHAIGGAMGGIVEKMGDLTGAMTDPISSRFEDQEADRQKRLAAARDTGDFSNPLASPARPNL
jgi:hypothetical protein